MKGIDRSAVFAQFAALELSSSARHAASSARFPSTACVSKTLRSAVERLLDHVERHRPADAVLDLSEHDGAVPPTLREALERSLSLNSLKLKWFASAHSITDMPAPILQRVMSDVMTTSTRCATAFALSRKSLFAQVEPELRACQLQGRYIPNVSTLARFREVMGRAPQSTPASPVSIRDLPAPLRLAPLIAISKRIPALPYDEKDAATRDVVQAADDLLQAPAAVHAAARPTLEELRGLAAAGPLHFTTTMMVEYELATALVARGERLDSVAARFGLAEKDKFRFLQHHVICHPTCRARIAEGVSASVIADRYGIRDAYMRESLERMVVDGPACEAAIDAGTSATVIATRFGLIDQRVNALLQKKVLYAPACRARVESGASATDVARRFGLSDGSALASLEHWTVARIDFSAEIAAGAGASSIAQRSGITREAPLQHLREKLASA